MSCEALGKMSTQTKSGHVPGLVTGNGGQTWGVTVSIELGNLPWQGVGGGGQESWLPLLKHE